jgi:hypothetical protein
MSRKMARDRAERARALVRAKKHPIRERIQ